MRIRSAVIMFLSFWLIGCNSDYSPKPRGYVRIERLSSNYLDYETPYFSFLRPDISVVQQVKSDKTGYWFNINYPDYKTNIYCTYSPVTKNDLSKLTEDSYHLAYSHSSVATNIRSSLYQSNDKVTAGTIYDIEGSVASPLQFYVTDSVKHFLRGSVYFENKVNPDSVAPIVGYIREDLTLLIESVNWK